MALEWNISKPVASEIVGVDFSCFSTEEILKISVKQIVQPVTFDGDSDSIRPKPGGLYDPALGASRELNIICSTCSLDYKFCPGHLGHIALPIPVCHPMFFDIILRLLRSVCVYCYHLRMNEVEVNLYACKLHLLQHGLVTEAVEIDRIGVKAPRQQGEGEARHAGEMDDWEEIDPKVIIESRRTFVQRKICAYKGESNSRKSAEHLTTISDERRILVREFMRQITASKKCSRCNGISPTFRKDGYSRIFENPLKEKERESMIMTGIKRRNAALDKRKTLFRRDEKKKQDVDAMDIDEGIVEDTLEEVEEEPDTEHIRVSMSPKNGRVMSGLEIRNILLRLFENESEVFSLVFQPRLYGKRGAKKPTADMFFLHAIAVPPTKFRPPAKTGSDLRESAQNTPLVKILRDCFYIRDTSKNLTDPKKDKVKELKNLYNGFTTLQQDINAFLDSSKSTPLRPGRAIQDGIKQILEKKEGLFRMHMMGKRVNFAARSVISPDPNIETSEIGVPPVFAKKLTYPEPVTTHNFEKLRAAVENGPDQWPGASQIEMEDGKLINLARKSSEERHALASQLLTASVTLGSLAKNKKVYRHVRDGDIVIMNRQPTLHKPSMMAHYVKVLPGEKTIRMHYANCNTYNADFDGDEMNLHLPQGEIARAEAYNIANTNNQYLVATSGKPLRGLIQDHLVMGVWMTSRDTMFTRDEYQQLLYSCLRPEDGHVVGDLVATPENLNPASQPLNRILMIEPAIQKPQKLWTGKQLITSILYNICRRDSPGLTMASKSKISGDRWGKGSEEGQVIFSKGYYVSGILDKNQFGPSEYGFVHSVYEVYGSETAGKLLSILGRLFTKFLHMRAFTCGMDDLLLTPKGNRLRKEKLKDADKVGKEVAIKYVGLTAENFSEKELKTRMESVLRDDTKQSGLDLVTNSRTKDFTSSIIAVCLPNGLVKPFPANNMQTMTQSGAKGSDVNSSQISCLLGQQTLEGRRVPVMVSGKTLPCFRPFETDVRAGGYIADRFLTGIRPQEYYFHCMAGREGLIDTAVKTARSGYLQRCLIKGMEGVKVQYDNTVRDSDGSLVQFLYGEDALDVTKQKHLMQFKFVAENQETMLKNSGLREEDLARLDTSVKDYNKKILKKLDKGANPIDFDTALSVYSPGKYLGSVSERFSRELNKYMEKNPDSLIISKSESKALKKARSKEGAVDTKVRINHSLVDRITEENFRMFMYLKYMQSLVEPGEAVGIVAGQSVGEPSTQMTLNTFHLAGHATKNVTLGIPRLREIVMTASASISTPTMTLTMVTEKTEEETESFRKEISRLVLSEIVDKVTVTEKLQRSVKSGEMTKAYVVRLDLFPRNDYMKEYNVTQKEVLHILKSTFVDKLVSAVNAKFKNKKTPGAEDSLPEVGKSHKRAREAAESSPGEDGQGDDEGNESEESDDGEDGDATSAKARVRKQELTSYDDPDEEERGELEEGGKESEDIDSAYEGSEGEIDDAERSRLKIAEEREAEIKGSHENVSKFTFDDKGGQWCEVGLECDISKPKILMLNIVEKVVKETVIHELKGIKSVTRIPDSEVDKEGESERGKRKLTTEGVNFPEIWKHCGEFVKEDEIFTNDIAAMLRHYGVEAARKTIIQECKAVFGGHGISVDTRHLSLIADMMTRSGKFSPFNRMGLITSHTSPFLKMSFETTTNFLRDAIIENDWDDLRSPSSQLVVGKLSGVGTGSFDVLVGLQKPEIKLNSF